MGEIVELPNHKPLKSKKEKWLCEPLHANAHKSQELDFTCVTCQNKTTLQLNNATLKQMEIFCGKCGQGWKVTNPQFAVRKAGNT